MNHPGDIIRVRDGKNLVHAGKGGNNNGENVILKQDNSHDQT